MASVLGQAFCSPCLHCKLDRAITRQPGCMWPQTISHLLVPTANARPHAVPHKRTSGVVSISCGRLYNSKSLHRSGFHHPRGPCHEAGPDHGWVRTTSKFRLPLVVAELSKIAGMSPWSCQGYFRAITGTPPLQHQKDLRMIEARAVLMACVQSVASAGIEFGYENPTLISRVQALVLVFL